jgi:anti-sigma B factor antagonist
MRDSPDLNRRERPQALPGDKLQAARGPLARGEVQPRARLLLRPLGEILIVDFLNAQALVEDQELGELSGCLIRLVRQGHIRILLNLQGVHYASSSLIGNLAGLHQRLVAAHGYLKLYGLEPMVRDALRICCLDRTMEIYGTESDALASVGKEEDNPSSVSTQRCPSR